ncbi:Siderophore iron transporter mirB [Ceratocystis fimbriata CBS 114723]|uniref:Siderophore iron transporter mirB n=1 Tax=Ceratocystis fimbriata CBS 114723 TaxID=1035309 RepID=A0A2C5X382_9PEZI|nr:Siderophore iron transporter mirB [Ceratocystis fimbriata CBS 114723]
MSDRAPILHNSPRHQKTDYGTENLGGGQSAGSSQQHGLLPIEEERAATADLPAGVAKVEAVTMIWTIRDLKIAYALIWFIYLVDTLQQTTTGNLLAWVTSDFSAHSLTAATTVVSSLLSGLLKPTLAKVLDTWGRPQGYAISVATLTIGLMTMAACNGVGMFAAGQVFYWVGYNGLSYTLNIFIADTSALKNRSLMFAFSTSPYLITTFVGGFVADAFLGGPGWRWAYGVFAVITPAITMPLFVLMWRKLKTAKEAGLVPVRPNTRARWERIKGYLIDFDVVGLVLIVTGSALLLLPFNLYTRQREGWHSPLIIAMLAVGSALTGIFVIYEAFYAPVKYIPYSFFKDRTIVGAFALSAILMACFYIWNSYFSSFLQVVNNLDVVQANYVSNIFTIGSCLWSIVTGVIIRKTGRFRGLALYFGVPLTILGVSLMIKFRQPGVNIGYVCMCQILIALSGGTLVITKEMAVMAAVSHQQIAIILAVEAMFASLGGAVGSTIASAIWQHTFPQKLQDYLPDEVKPELAKIVGSIAVQKSYHVGSAARDAIEKAYADTQRVMLIVTSAVLAFSIICVAVWRDYNVKDYKQVKGTVV